MAGIVSNAGQGRLPLGTSLSGCGNKVIACDLDNLRKLVSIGLPSSTGAELTESSSPP